MKVRGRFLRGLTVLLALACLFAPLLFSRRDMPTRVGEITVTLTALDGDSREDTYGLSEELEGIL